MESVSDPPPGSVEKSSRMGAPTGVGQLQRSTPWDVVTSKASVSGLKRNRTGRLPSLRSVTLTAKSPSVSASTATAPERCSGGWSLGALSASMTGVAAGVGSSPSAIGGDVSEGNEATTGSTPSMAETACRISEREPAGHPRCATTVASGDKARSECSPKQ